MESSNVETWFEKSNNEVRDTGVLFADNDPPFLMRNSSSSETPPNGQQQRNTFLDHDDNANSLPFRTDLLQPGTDGSNTEDFRGVIDDLTVENKKLKRRLKRYEKLHDSHLKDEKSFEVRIHGLSVEKKRELEESLRKFASSLGPTEANAFPAGGYSSLMPMLKASKPASSQASLQHADSAYASMSASGQGSTAQSGNNGKQTMTPTQYIASRRENIHSYLHDIPEGLLPQQNPATMSERAKKKLVVSKMEQIFAGKGAASADNQQSLQQQEVSQSAARTDQSAMEAAGQRTRQEGTREARIMEHETEDLLDLSQHREKDVSMNTSEQQSKDAKSIEPQDFTERSPEHASVEQRPTRPLDLDPHRAQVPVDNVRYMRRLGFSPPDPESREASEQEHGWIYLNFLINMAQLHTMNVTTEFVRKALSEHSDKLEVSNDGRKVRWKGGSSPTRSSSGGGSSNERTRDELPEGQRPRKRPKLSHRHSSQSNIGSSLQQRGVASKRLQAENSKHMYTPLFSHRVSADYTDESSSEVEDDSILSPAQAPLGAGESSGMTTSGIHTTSGYPATSRKKQQKRDDGPIIFYTNARFCTDLSGDPNPNENYNAPTYVPATTLPVGMQQPKAAGNLEQRGPLAEASELPDPMDLDENLIPQSTELSFLPWSPTDSLPAKEQVPIDLEVTGIGGVIPADNFAISVESRYARVDQQRAPDVSGTTASKSLPPRFINILRGSESNLDLGAAVESRFVASKVQQLPPSELPPALSFMAPGDSSLDDNESDDDDDEMSDSPVSTDAFPPSAAPQPVDFPATSEDEDDEENDDEEEEESDDGELDFLATAREADPEAVRQREREYDANIAERLAEEIPAGSSAATAGGGSGFASPAKGVKREEYHQAMQEARTKVAGFGRFNTSDSMVVHMKDILSDSEEEDNGISDVVS